MARGGKKKRRSRNGPKEKPAPPPAASPEPEPLDETLDRIDNAAMADATDADMEAMDSAQVPSDASAKALVKRAAETLALLEAQRNRALAAEEKVQKMEAELAKQLDDSKIQRQMLGDREAELTQRTTDLTAREEKQKESEADLLKRQEAIVRRELDADAGFMQRDRDALRNLEAAGEAFREQFWSHRKRMSKERQELAKELQAKRHELAGDLEAQREAARLAADAARKGLAAELAEARTQIERDQETVKTESQRLQQLASDLELDRGLLVEDQETIDDKVAKRAARELELKDGEIGALTERLASAREERDRLSQLLGKREEADRCFGEETPEQVLTRVRALEKERNQLRESLGELPSAEAVQRLEELERQKELWESDKLKILAELGDARQEAARKRIAVTELESLRDEKRSLESGNSLMQEANRQLRAEVDALVKRGEGKSPFPSCSKFDDNTELQSTIPTQDTIDLSEFAERVRHGMAIPDPETGKELFYSPEDVRSFIGGLAMSRLHLLQGNSGTGKTSLPKAFCRVIGAPWQLIEVQAGWRDRQDLLGHFNSFAGVFYESKFLQALYMASCPRYQSLPFIVILDEMNLSHPEQYFADFISLLEQDPQDQLVELMTAEVDPHPRLLREGGKKLLIPPNVWFVGTANHDETTAEFADKTYDRAHVMELPRNRETFSRKDFQPQKPVSLSALTEAFDAAVDRYQEDAVEAFGFLETHLGDILDRRFRVGWANRLERQMSFFVPVVRAAGGSRGEATDHILATKLLRKIRDRHDNRPEHIKALRDCIKTEWHRLDTEAEPTRSLELLRRELSRFGQDGD